MSKESQNITQEQAYNAPVKDIVEQRIAAAAMAASSGLATNPIEFVNTHNLIEAKKKWIKASYDKQGKTVPMAALDLAADACRPIRHSRILANNLIKASGGQCRPEFTDAHHIVGRLDLRAHRSRIILFNKSIGMNDADNGGFIPRYRSSVVPCMPKAHFHQEIHTGTYYLTVELRLRSVANQPEETVRATLREIKKEIIAGTFPI